MFKLRPYQQKLVTESRNCLAQGMKGVFIQSPPGSGKSVVIAEIVRLATKKGGRVLFLAHRRELLDNIKETLELNDVNLSKVIILSPMMAKNRMKSMPKISLIVTDESHHSKAKTYLDIYTFFKEIPRLGFSATPFRMNGDGFTDIYDVMVQGPSIQWLIDNHCLAPFKWYGVNTIDRLKVDFKSLTSEARSAAEQFNEKVIQGDIIENYRKLADGQQAIVYAPTITVSQEIVRLFNKNGISAIHCDAKTKKDERSQIMKDFKDSKFKILSNVDLISEGFNVPDVGVIILCRPTKSLVLHLQQSMRGMRYRPGKTSIIIDHVGNGVNLGLPTSYFEWTLEGRKKNKSESEYKPQTITCGVCGQVLVKTDDLTHCPSCGNELVVEEKEEKHLEDLVNNNRELHLLKNDDIESAIWGSRPYRLSYSLIYNYQVAMHKNNKKGKILYKLFGYLTAYKGKEYSHEQIEDLVNYFDLDLSDAYRAYYWAKRKYKQDTDKQRKKQGFFESYFS
ncbi:DEAD/DEAH box helicase [Enterococcus cecorum]|nr:DEAD/DEAH box helicase [Enterococcus cecorum]